MKSISPRSHQRRRAFTLIELLVVIAIIGILAALLLPVLGRAKVQAQVRRAQIEIGDLVTAIHAYEAAYNHFPASSNAASSVAVPALREDFTYGGTYQKADGTPLVIEALGNYKGNNAEVMAVLLDLEYYPDGQPTINLAHVKNPQRTKFLNPKMVTGTSPAGVGSDGVYRDPWGNPYIITLDLNYDDRARDAFYRLQSVSQSANTVGLNGLHNTVDKPSGNGNHFEANSPVMVWSVGPDKKADPNPNPNPPPFGSANIGVNKDNILSWKQ